MILNALKDFFFGLLYKMQAGICNLIDFIKSIFYKLCGLDAVIKDGESVDLVSDLIMSNTIHRIFLTIFLIGVILLALFCIIALIRANYQNNDKKTRAGVLVKSGQAFLMFLLVPFLLLAAIMLTNVVMGSVNTSMQQYLTSNSTIGGQMLVTTGYEAYIGKPPRAEIEQMFLSGQLDYTNIKHVEMYYNIHDINYLVGLLGGLVILIMFAISALTFIQRIFDIILLYVISPISISTVPLDDGNRFKLWKDMLVSKILSAYGIIIVMNLFFLIIPQISRMTFFNNTFQNGVVHILFLIGGAFAVTKANLVISQLSGAQSGGRELAQMIYNIRSGIAFGKSTTGAVAGLVGRAVGGSDYLKSRKQGNSKIESLGMSIVSNRNQHVMSEANKVNKGKQIAGAPLRLATMPVGMIKDVMNGGVIQASKNFIPRLKNAITGDSLVSRADVKPKPKKAVAASDNQSAKNNGSTSGIGATGTIIENNTVASGMESDRNENPTATTSAIESNTISNTGAEAKQLNSLTTAKTESNLIKSSSNAVDRMKPVKEDKKCDSYLNRPKSK